MGFATSLAGGVTLPCACIAGAAEPTSCMLMLGSLAGLKEAAAALSGAPLGYGSWQGALALTLP